MVRIAPLLVLAGACTSSPDVASTPGEDTTVDLFAAEQVYFAGEDNRREREVSVDLPPADLAFAEIRLSFELSCPNGRCDPWDRWGSLSVVRGEGEDAVVIELSRFVTPFGIGASWKLDVTDLRPLLTGATTFRVFIDTWVGPGSQFGDGWEVDARLDFTGGLPERPVLDVVPVWPNTRVVYGDPARPVTDQLAEVDVALPEGAAALSLQTYTTGHGQGNADNCAEFCPKVHTLTVAGTAHDEEIWRDDCDRTRASGQAGTWTLPRAGWCPGARARAWTIDVDPSEGGSLSVAYDVEPYENTCRPDAATCTGCTLGTGCDYDGGAHTEPSYQVSAVVVAYAE